MRIAIKADVIQDGIGIVSKTDATGDLITTITLKVQIDPGKVARIINLQKMKGIPIYVELGTEQAAMDIFVAAVTNNDAFDMLNNLVNTGEIPCNSSPAPSDEESLAFQATIIYPDDLPFGGLSMSDEEPEDADPEDVITTVNGIIEERPKRRDKKSAEV